MGGEATNAALVSAVSEAGGLGVLGCLYRQPDDAVAEIERIRARTGRPFGVNFVLPFLVEETFDACLRQRVPVFVFFRGDPTRAIARARDAGAKTVFQVTTQDEARLACDAGVDVLIAQGMEAGGHMGPAALTTVVPHVVAVAGERPVVASGGIVDGRGLAAVLCLGAAGVSMGTRFLLSDEAPISDAEKQVLLRARPGDTVASEIPDMVWRETWPGVQVRAIRNAFLSRWLGREDELAAEIDQVAEQVERAEREQRTDEMIVLAGAGVGLIDSILPAGEIVRQTAREADAVLTNTVESVLRP